MAVLAQLADPAGYRPCEWDLRADPAGQDYWHGLFRWHLDAVLAPLIREEYGPTAARLAAFRKDYLAAYDLLCAPDSAGPLDVLRFTEVREDVLSRHQFAEPFRGVKQRENEAALALLPGVLAQIDAAGAEGARDPERSQALLVDGLMAGNIFDLGSKETIKLHQNGGPEISSAVLAAEAFAATRARVPPRPWLVDDVDRWEAHWRTAAAGERATYRHIVFFVDNAGSDVVLGCLPFVRRLCQLGTCVTLAANSGPALNDITAAELDPLIEKAVETDPLLAERWRAGQLRVAGTGSHTPLLDLTRLDGNFVGAVADADLLILHGMGRAIESNRTARFTCDVLRTAVIKDADVARRIGGKVFDCVFAFTPVRAAGR